MDLQCGDQLVNSIDSTDEKNACKTYDNFLDQRVDPMIIMGLISHAAVSGFRRRRSVIRPGNTPLSYVAQAFFQADICAAAFCRS